MKPADFNSYGARRGNHEVMMRGTFANIRLRNQMAPGTEGGWTKYQPTGELMTIYDASVAYQTARVPLMVIAGKEYGSGSSRDWAAKGTFLLGVKAVIAESFERIHRSNLVNMGVLPLQFKLGDNAASLKITGTESFRSDRCCLGLEAARRHSRRGHRGRRLDQRVHRHRSHRHARGTGRLQARRHPAVRGPAARRKIVGGSEDPPVQLLSGPRAGL